MTDPHPFLEHLAQKRQEYHQQRPRWRLNPLWIILALSLLLWALWWLAVTVISAEIAPWL